MANNTWPTKHVPTFRYFAAIQIINKFEKEKLDDLDPTYATIGSSKQIGQLYGV